jgi:hypothetical protein
VNLDVARLTREEGEELSEIVKRFWDAPEGTEPAAADVSRFEELVGQWAGDVNLFANSSGRVIPGMASGRSRTRGCSS